ncbi:MAG: L-threonylcarbamoyladenylate synthase [Chlamydiia bacterium]
MFVSIAEAIELLKTKKVVAVPSETVYGLAASIAFDEAIERIFTLKGRPSKNPLIVHFASIKDVLEYVAIDPLFTPELEKLWPGPLTIVAPLKKGISPLITAGLDTLAVRIPRNPVFLELIRAVGPLAAPSANRSGLPSATRSWHIENDYDGQIPIIEADLPSIGLESTILIQREKTFELGRLGATPIDSLKEFFPISSATLESETPLCPGQLLKHYAPNCNLTTEWTPEVEAIVGFHDVTYTIDRPLYNLGTKNDPRMIAERLFETLRLLDLDKIRLAFIDTNFPNHGLYKTLHERLSRALRQKPTQIKGTYV